MCSNVDFCSDAFLWATQKIREIYSKSVTFLNMFTEIEDYWTVSPVIDDENSTLIQLLSEEFYFDLKGKNLR